MYNEYLYKYTGKVNKKAGEKMKKITVRGTIRGKTKWQALDRLSDLGVMNPKLTLFKSVKPKSIHTIIKETRSQLTEQLSKITILDWHVKPKPLQPVKDITHECMELFIKMFKTNNTRLISSRPQEITIERIPRATERTKDTVQFTLSPIAT